jgi:anti-sigma regulatory factor (Ser/Thr protein kinase)
MLRLWAVPESVASARREVQRACTGAALSDEATHIATLLTSEVVTNAVVHARGVITFVVDSDVRSVSVAVTDEEPEPPARREEEWLGEGGRGVRLLDALAGAWGSRRRNDGKTVWFRVP